MRTRQEILDSIAKAKVELAEAMEREYPTPGWLAFLRRELPEDVLCSCAYHDPTSDLDGRKIHGSPGFVGFFGPSGPRTLRVLRALVALEEARARGEEV